MISNQMMNVNITFAMLQALNKVQERLGQNSSDWITEEKRPSIEQLAKREYNQ